MRTLFALIKKDLLLEFRTKETISVMVLLSLLMSVVLSLGIQSAFVNEVTITKLFPGLLWFIFVVTASVAVGRTYEYEVTHRAGEGLLLTGVPSTSMYLAKSISGTVLTLIGFSASVIALSVLLDVSLSVLGGEFIVVSVLTVIGYSALSTVVAAITSTSRLKNLLLPLLLIPMLFPLFFASVELTTQLMEAKSLAYDGFWFSLLLVLDLVYVVIGVVTYDAVICE